jgi:predicted CopG family antitoxin
LKTIAAKIGSFSPFKKLTDAMGIVQTHLHLDEYFDVLDKAAKAARSGSENYARESGPDVIKELTKLKTKLNEIFADIAYWKASNTKPQKVEIMKIVMGMLNKLKSRTVR